jgi:hypothetical protein
MEFRQVLKKLRREGFRVERTNEGHWKVFARDPTKGHVILSGNPRAMKRMEADLKRIGFHWPKGGAD